MRLGCLWCSEPLRTDFEKKTDWDKVGKQYVCVLNKLGRSRWPDTGTRWSESFAPISLRQALR